MAAIEEAMDLGNGMEVKHTTFFTGFAGAKLVCSATCDPRGWSAQDKATLISEAGKMLCELDGAMYTGCDMNTSTDDMSELYAQSPYVLAAIPNPSCCPNKATAFGVFGAVEASMGGDVSGKSFMVHGCGNVGATVAKLLVDHGASKVLTLDAIPARASLDGCTNISDDAAWWERSVDAVVPCSSSGLFTTECALKCSAIVGATNLPFATKRAQELAQANAMFIPEGVSSAGAVIVDSIEHFSRKEFVEAPPAELYEFTRQVVREKTGQLITFAGRLCVPPALVVPLIAEIESSGPVGLRFSQWLRQRENTRYVASLKPSGKATLERGRVTPADPGHSSGHLNGHVVPSNTTSRVRHKRGYSSNAASAEVADVAIVGAGIMGLNIAYQLKRRDPTLKVCVLEQAGAIGFGSSGYSTGFQRAYYSFDETMQFALDGMVAYKNWKDYLRDDSAEAYFTETGALWMLGYDAAQNAAMRERLAKFGVSSDLIDEAELAKRFPLISAAPLPSFNEDGVEIEQDLGAFSAVYEHGCGHLDSSTCLTDLLKACRRDGVDIRFNQRVEAFETAADGARCTGVRLKGGHVISAGSTVNAAGPWFNKLNETVDVRLSTEALPTRIQVGHKWVPDEFCSLPFVADGWGPSGIYFMPRAANNQLIFGSVAHRFESEIVDPDAYNTSLDPNVKQDYLSCLFHRLPTLPHAGDIVGFSSMYTVNQDDVHPMIGETKLAGLWACNGFSGHGFKLAPAVGSLVAQQLTGLTTDVWETSVPHDFMGPYREPLTLKVKTHFA